MDGEEKSYGGCEGPDAMYVKLISSDGHEFIVKREHALTSGTIKAMLSGPGIIIPHSICNICPCTHR
uniref:SKP1 component POZ domain-containing protein n=1 Tax=Peromyscus maniculatus bairdii TaxID=230844 RepID=A0A8C8TID2_PERMB